MEQLADKSANITCIDEAIFLILIVRLLLLLFCRLLSVIRILRRLLLLRNLLGIKAVLILVVSLIRILRLLLGLFDPTFVQLLELFEVEYGADSIKHIGLAVPDADFHQVDNKLL